MASFTNKEIEALNKFRPLVTELNLNDEQRSDHFLIRWLRARDLHQQHAFDMLKKSMAWREENKIDEISSWKPPANFHEDYPFDIDGVDKDGCPILLLPWGKWNTRKAVEAGQRQDYLRFMDQIVEKMFEKMRTINKSRPGTNPITQISCIADMRGYSMKQLTHKGTVDCLLEVVKRFEANFPELMKCSYTINAPKFFAVLFALVKPLLHQRTLEKVQIFSKKQKKWMPGLLKLIPIDQLPEIYGGTRKLKNNLLDGPGDSDDIADGEMCVVTVGAGDTTTIAMDVAHANSTISWKFRTEESSIGFAVYLNDGEQLISQEKVDSHVTLQEGKRTCDKAGKYTLVFNNVDGTAKTLHYTVAVSSEDSDEEAD